MQEIRNVDSIPGSERSPGGEHGNLLQYSCLENPMNRGVWWAMIHRVTKSWTQLKPHSTQNLFFLNFQFQIWHILLFLLWPWLLVLNSIPHSKPYHTCSIGILCLSTQQVFIKSIPFLSFIEPIFAWNVPLVSLIFLKRSLVFPILLLSSISLHWLLRKAFLSLLAILWNSAFRCLYLSRLLFASLLSQLFVRPSQTAILLFCISFPWGWSWSLSPLQCPEPPSVVHQALCLSDLVP